MYPVLSMAQLPIIIKKSDYYFVFILIELIEWIFSQLSPLDTKAQMETLFIISLA